MKLFLICLLMVSRVFALEVNGQLKGALLEKLSSDPTGTEGRIYQNTATYLPKFYNGSDWITTATTTYAQTLTNKTIDDELRLKQISTPSDPVSGYNKLYFKSDDKLYKKTSGGVESELATSGGSGTLEHQYSLTISGAVYSSTDRAVGVVYKTNDGAYRMRFNIVVAVSAGLRTGTTLTIANVTFKNVTNYNQPIVAIDNVNTIPDWAYASPNSGNLVLVHVNASTVRYYMSGDVELDSKPSFATDIP